RRQRHGKGSARPPGERLDQDLQGRRQDQLGVARPRYAPWRALWLAATGPPREVSGSKTMNEAPRSAAFAHRAVLAMPRALSVRVRGLSDRAIAWIFIAPTMVLLLAINIFPLIWTIRLSFTNYRANRPNAPVRDVGLQHYQDILTPMMLSPAVVGNFWTFLFQPQIGLFNYVVGFFTGIPPSSFQMLGDVQLSPWAIVLVDTWMWTPYVMLICLAGLRAIPENIYEAAEVDRASKWRQFWTITL